MCGFLDSYRCIARKNNRPAVKAVMADGGGGYVLLRHVASKRCTDSKTFDATVDCSPRMALLKRPLQLLLRVDSVTTQLVFSDSGNRQLRFTLDLISQCFRCSHVRYNTSIVYRFLEMSTGASADGTVLRSNIVRPWCVCFLDDDCALVTSCYFFAVCGLQLGYRQEFCRFCR